MKKRLVLLTVCILSIVLIVVGCGKKTELAEDKGQAQETSNENLEGEEKFKEEDGILTYLDTENSPFDDLGLKILIEKGSEGYVKFIKTDLTGKESVDYYIFNYANNTFEKYYFVSAMGSGFYYYYDLEEEELTKVEDKDHNDSTQGMKESNRWDSAVENTKDDIKILEEYFEEQYNSTIKEFVLGQ